MVGGAAREPLIFTAKNSQRLGSDESIALPAEPYQRSGLTNHHIYHQYVIRTPQRDALREHLTRKEIGTAIYYPLALHEQKCFRYLGYRAGDFPESERAAHETLALPMYPEISREAVSATSRNRSPNFSGGSSAPSLNFKRRDRLALTIARRSARFHLPVAGPPQITCDPGRPSLYQRSPLPAMRVGTEVAKRGGL